MPEETMKMYGFFIEQTAKKIRQHLQKKLNEIEADITVDQWVILDLLQKTDGLSQNELAIQSYKDAPTVTRIIDLLCKKGLLARHADQQDRRRFNIVLTNSGKQKIKEVYPTVVAVRKQGWSGLGSTEYEQLIGILNKVFKNLNHEQAQYIVK